MTDDEYIDVSMSVDDLKQVIKDIGDNLVFVKDQITPDSIDQVIVLLTNLQNNLTLLSMLLVFVQSIIPNMNKDLLLQNVQKIIVIANKFKQIETSGQLNKLINFLNKIENSNLILKMLALLI